MIIIKCSVCGTDISILEDMTCFACPKCRTVQNRQITNQEITSQEIPMGISVSKHTQDSKQIQGTSQSNIDEKDFLERVFMELEDGQFQYAEQLCNQILYNNPSNAKAYLGKLMAELKVRTVGELAYSKVFHEKPNYQKCIQFADEELRKKLMGYLDFIQKNEKERSVKRKAKIKRIIGRGIAVLVIILIFIALWYGETISNTYNSINKIKKAEIGDTVEYGTYQMTESGDKLGIEWIIADKEDGKALLVSKYYLDILEYRIQEGVVLNFSWKKSELRDWLNKEFWNKAFSDLEQWRIEESLVKSYSKKGERVRTYDHVFVVSYEAEEDIKNLKEELTEYAYNEAFNYSDNPTYHTFFSSYEFLGEYIEDGFRTFGGTREGCLIRPAIWVDYNSIIP